MSFTQGAPTQNLSIVASNIFVTGTSTSGNAFTVQQLGSGNVASFVTVSGSSALFINPAGNVGIGTASPIAQLHAYQSNGTGYQLSINNVANAGGSNYSAFIHSDQAYCGGVGGVGQYTYSGASLLVTSYPNNTANNSGYTAYFGTSANDATSLAPQMVIKAATGNVGINTNNPGTYNLNLYGTTSGTSTTVGALTNSGGSLSLMAGVNAAYIGVAGTYKYYFSGTEFAPQNGTGSVNIGTAGNMFGTIYGQVLTTSDGTNGYVSLLKGNTTLPGYMSINTPSNRVGYVGWAGVTN